MFDLLDLPPVTDHSAAVRIAGLLASGTLIARRGLNQAMIATFGGSDADGHWTQRDSFEMLEHGIALHLASKPYQLNGMADVAQASAIMAMLPTQTVRSEEQIDLQQFSTPVDIAAIAVLVAAINADDIVLEPSAGNGLLIVQAPACASLQLNEIDTKRRDRLAGIFPDAIVTGHDGAALVSLHARLPKPTVVLLNPPFSRSVGRGADDLAALRHLQAAIRRVAKGGRVVAIMPDWFAPSARLKAAYEAVLTGCTVRTSLRLEHCYRKHGTDIAVRLYVIDKVAGGTSHTVIQRSSVAGFLDAVTVPPRASLVADTPIAALPVPKPSLFGAARQAKATVARTYNAPVRNNVLPVSYKTLATAAPLADQVGCYLPYRPSRIVFDVAGDHPTALVESVAMGSIPAPIPTHIAHLPERTVTERMLSSSQLETVVYAGHAWGQLLPGSFKPAKEGVGLTIDPEGSRYRKGFFLGDGTGAGKGRQVAACILDNWLQGRRRHIWVSKNEPLLLSRLYDSVSAGALPVYGCRTLSEARYRAFNIFLRGPQPA